jgi:hypothetical protein
MCIAVRDYIFSFKLKFELVFRDMQKERWKSLLASNLVYCQKRILYKRKFRRTEMRLSERSEFQNIVKKVNKPVSLTLRIVEYLYKPQFQISPSSLRIVLHQHVQSH